MKISFVLKKQPKEKFWSEIWRIVVLVPISYFVYVMWIKCVTSVNFQMELCWKSTLPSLSCSLHNFTWYFHTWCLCIWSPQKSVERTEVWHMHGVKCESLESCYYWAAWRDRQIFCQCGSVLYRRHLLHICPSCKRDRPLWLLKDVVSQYRS